MIFQLLAEIKSYNLFMIRAAAKCAQEWTMSGHMVCCTLCLTTVSSVSALVLFRRWSWAEGKCLSMWVFASVFPTGLCHLVWSEFWMHSHVWLRLCTEVMARSWFTSGRSQFFCFLSKHRFYEVFALGFSAGCFSIDSLCESRKKSSIRCIKSSRLSFGCIAIANQ